MARVFFIFSCLLVSNLPLAQIQLVHERGTVHIWISIMQTKINKTINNTFYFIHIKKNMTHPVLKKAFGCILVISKLLHTRPAIVTFLI